MDVVLGVSMTPSAIYTSLADGDRAAGVTIDEDMLAVPADARAADEVVAAVLAARQQAHDGGYRLSSIGVTCVDQGDTAALSDALADHELGTVMVVSGFLAAAALTQTVGKALGYPHTALLYLEPQTLTVAVVDSATGAIGAVHRRALTESGADRTAVLSEALTELTMLETRPGGLYLVGAGADVRTLRDAAEALTALPVNLPEEPALALAQGAAVAAAHAPLFTMSTQALAYSRDPGTDGVAPEELARRFADGVAGGVADDGRAYSAESSGADHGEDPDSSTRPAGALRRRRTPLLVGSSMAVILVIGTVALVISLALDIRPAARLLPNFGDDTPAAPAPPPAQTIEQPAPVVQQVPPPDAVVPPQAPAASPAPKAPPLAPPAPRAPSVPEVVVPPPAQAVRPDPPAAPAPEPPAVQAPDPPAVQAPDPPPAAPVPVPIPLPVMVPDVPIFSPPKAPVEKSPPKSPPKVDPPKAPRVPKAPDPPRWQPPWQPEKPKAPKVPKTPELPKAPKAPKTPELPKAPKAPKVPSWQPKAPKAPKVPSWQPKRPPAWQPKAPSLPKLPFPDLRLPF